MIKKKPASVTVTILLFLRSHPPLSQLSYILTTRPHLAVDDLELESVARKHAPRDTTNLSPSVSPATIRHQLGIDHENLAHRFNGLDIKLTGVEGADLIGDMIY